MKGVMYNNKFYLEDAVFDGTKTLTRRLINFSLTMLDSNYKVPASEYVIFEKDGRYYFEHEGTIYNLPKESYPQYKVGEIVAIKQSYETIDDNCRKNDFYDTSFYDKLYDALDLDRSNGVAPLNLAGWKNKMFVRNDLMPYTIEITGVRAERLQDISDEDCLKEGICGGLSPYGEKVYYVKGLKLPKKHLLYFSEWAGFYTAKQTFATLIDKINGKGTWDSNPWVFVYDFRLVKQ